MSVNKPNMGIKDDKAQEPQSASSPKVAPTPGGVAASGVSHTSGPWAVYHDGLSVCDATGHLVSTAVEGRTDAEAKANARLIAAAPELLEALAELHRDWLQLSRSGDGCELGRKVRAALAKVQP